MEEEAVRIRGKSTAQPLRQGRVHHAKGKNYRQPVFPFRLLGHDFELLWLDDEQRGCADDTPVFLLSLFRVGSLSPAQDEKVRYRAPRRSRTAGIVRNKIQKSSWRDHSST